MSGRRGSTTCPNCQTVYKNNARPPVCTTDGCAYPIGNIYDKDKDLAY